MREKWERASETFGDAPIGDSGGRDFSSPQHEAGPFRQVSPALRTSAECPTGGSYFLRVGRTRLAQITTPSSTAIPNLAGGATASYPCPFVTAMKRGQTVLPRVLDERPDYCGTASSGRLGARHKGLERYAVTKPGAGQ